MPSCFAFDCVMGVLWALVDRQHGRRLHYRTFGSHDPNRGLGVSPQPLGPTGLSLSLLSDSRDAAQAGHEGRAV